MPGRACIVGLVPIMSGVEGDTLNTASASYRSRSPDLPTFLDDHRMVRYSVRPAFSATDLLSVIALA